MIDKVKRYELRFLALCMVLLGAAAVWLVMTRPTHRIEGDILEREDARQVDQWLREQIRSPIAESQARACLALGRIADASTLDLLLEAATGPSARVRAAAAFAIGEIEDRQTAATAGREPRQRAADRLIELLRDDERAVVANAVEALGKMVWLAALERLKTTPAPLPFTYAAMARMDATQATPWIAQGFRSDDQSVRLAAADALNRLMVPFDEEITRLFLNRTKDRDPRVRAAAVEGLARAEPSEKVLAALTKTTDDRDPKVRMRAFGSLAALGREESLEVIVKGLGDPNINVRTSAVEALGTLGSRRAIPLLQSLRSEANPISQAAATAMARFAANDEESIGRLEDGAAGNQLSASAEGSLEIRLNAPGAAMPGETMPGAAIPSVAIPSAAINVRYSRTDYQRIARTLNRHLTIHTSAGSFELELDYDNAPLTAERFLELAGQGRFDGRSFSFVEPTRLAGFDASIPDQDDAASPTVRCEINQQLFVRGSLAIVADPKDSGGDHFFICLRELPEFDGRYTNFGRLISGDSLIDEITEETRILQIRSP